MVLDISVVNPALPTIGADLELSSGDPQWLVTAYLLMSGGGLLLGGRIADLLSGRRVLLTGLTVFTTASLVSGFASTAGVFDRRPRRAGTGCCADDTGGVGDHHDHLRGRATSKGPPRCGARSADWASPPVCWSAA